jgi:hypothetical protein
MFKAGTWFVAPVGTTVLAISCPVSGFCIATNSAGGVVEYHGGAWSRVPVDGTTVISALSCATSIFCVAIDHRGQVVYYRPE